ncbi:uncharacterized protein PV06_04148 [Exophiala oligosperma]|uniref:NAD(P)-binding protein n=1 Tax=Exophiala oligosperma TaxID=215243 RepID=A0A0D2DS16_9EURO|nr:uncharacterized protein PV06_04148 [Exophiala oligosperma]KIW45793.1 hypothetical protein PV06_04148 [Exophiala oligosperma]
MDVPGFALVTGAGSGIGRSCAITFASEGAAGVAVLDISMTALDTVKAEIEFEHKDCRVLAYQLDVTNEDQVGKAVDEIARVFGRIDYLVNCAGTTVKHVGGTARAETKDWARVLDLNLNGTFYMSRAVLRVMLSQEHIISSRNKDAIRRGSIVNLSSILGVVGAPMSAAYVASKHAVIGFTKAASEDYAKDGIRVNAVCPGYTDTPLSRGNGGEPLLGKIVQEKVAREVPIGRIGQPHEIADCVVWLSGGRSSMVTGAVIVADGGFTQK